mmetsp:Transcript_85034/g.259722  ORF Transcript_85034/g.259722 Transcript_85034/m.259722 type:complete len:383 (-) Transcript_85034:1880-3028(-)
MREVAECLLQPQADVRVVVGPRPGLAGAAALRRRVQQLRGPPGAGGPRRLARGRSAAPLGHLGEGVLPDVLLPGPAVEQAQVGDIPRRHAVLRGLGKLGRGEDEGVQGELSGGAGAVGHAPAVGAPGQPHELRRPAHRRAQCCDTAAGLVGRAGLDLGVQHGPRLRPRGAAQPLGPRHGLRPRRRRPEDELPARCLHRGHRDVRQCDVPIIKSRGGRHGPGSPHDLGDGLPGPVAGRLQAEAALGLQGRRVRRAPAERGVGRDREAKFWRLRRLWEYRLRPLFLRPRHEGPLRFHRPRGRVVLGRGGHGGHQPLEGRQLGADPVRPRHLVQLADELQGIPVQQRPESALGDGPDLLARRLRRRIRPRRLCHVARAQGADRRR